MWTARPWAVIIAIAMSACSTSDAGSSPTASTPGRPTIVDSTTTTASPARSTNADPAFTAATAEICADRSPVVTALIGTVNTIVVADNAGAFDVTVSAVPAAACPGDRVSFRVAVENVAFGPERFSPNRGLLIRSGGMANWSLGELGPVDLAPGERWQTTVVAAIPPLGPGEYVLAPEGMASAGTMTVLDPTQTPSG